MAPGKDEEGSIHEDFVDEGGEGNKQHHESNQHEWDGGGCGVGILKDFKRTVGTHWCTEMTNLNQKTIAVSFFLFFACISPAITFGGVYGKTTHNWIGAVEMITATAWCGITYALIGGQPMMINGGTGPVLAFIGVLYKMSNSMNVPFLSFNAWVGLWVTVYMLIAAFVDLNRYMHYATRFTDEIFALLISAIFIIDALGNPFGSVGIAHYFKRSHKSHDEYEDDEDYSHMATALLSLVLCLGTTSLAFLLRGVKFSPYFCNQTTRTIITDFSVVASVVFFTFVAQVPFDSVETETLNVPDTFAPTYECCTSECVSNFPEDCPEQQKSAGRRPWIVDLGDLNGKSWVPFMSAVPALLAFILVFLDDGITWHLINHPCHKLKHGVAFNYDTIIVGLMIAVNSMLGLPWLVAATVRSLTHIHAMAEKDKSGKFISVQETRLTHLFIHILVFTSIFFLSLLKLIPMPVLYGVFLFMGLASLGTNQFWGRVLMFFMQPSKYPKEPHTQYMSNRKMHIYTSIQLSLFALLYAVKSIKPIAIAFPLVIAACIPVRTFVLPNYFTKDELIVIDTDEDEVKAWLVRTGRNVGESAPASEGEEEGDENDS